MKEKKVSMGMSGILRKYMLEIILLILFVTLSIVANNFFTVNNVMTILRNYAMQGIIAFGMTMVIITGEIDLSVGSQVAFSGCLAAWLVQKFEGLGVPINVAVIISGVAVIALAFCVGLFVAFMRNTFNVPTFITTLAFMTVLSGAALLITNGFPITSFPQWYGYLGAGFIADVFPFQAVILVIVFLIIYFVLKYTEFGRSVYAVGGNVEAARLSGVNIKNVRRITMGTTQALSALAGLMISSQIMSGTPTVAKGWEMTVISAVIIGGASLNGGKGKVSGTFVGILFLGVLLNGMTLLNVSTYWQEVMRGILVLLAVLLNMVNSRAEEGK